MTTHFYYNLDDGDNAEARCLALVARCCPRFMKAGGGPLRQELLHSGKRLTQEARAAVNAALVAGNGTGIRRIATEHGVSPAAVSKMWKKIKEAHA